MLFLFLFHILPIVDAQLTSIQQWPGYDSMRDCAQTPFGCRIGCPDVWNQLGCHDWYCICGHFEQEFSFVSSAASSYCSGNQQDIASATSIFNAFCAQLSTTLTGPSAPTTAPAQAAPATNQMTLITVSQTTTSTKLVETTMTPSCICNPIITDCNT